MCGRFVLKAHPSELVTRFGLDECADFGARYNIPPGTDIPVIRQSPEGKRVLHLLRWGLVPHWAKDPSIGAKLNNARGESVAEKPSFRDAFKRRRCLVPANGFYEWKAEGKIKQPYYISPKDGQALLAATPINMLVNEGVPKKLKGVTADQMAKMEREMANLEGQFKLVEQSYGQDVLNLVLAKGYLTKLLDNETVIRFLSQNHPDILREFSGIVQTTSLDK